MSNMSKRKLKAIGYVNTHLDVDDDLQWRRFVCEMEDTHLRRRDCKWLKSTSEAADKEKWIPVIDQYLADIGVDTSSTRRVAADQLLNVVVAKLYEEKKDTLDNFTAAKFAESKKAVTNQTVPADVDCSSPEVRVQIGELCRLVGVAEHPDPIVSLKAACLFIKNNLSDESIERHNKEIESGAQFNHVDISSLPLGIPEPNDPIVAKAARILRVLNVEALRETQALVNDTLATIQNIIMESSVGKLAQQQQHKNQQQAPIPKHGTKYRK